MTIDEMRAHLRDVDLFPNDWCSRAPDEDIQGMYQVLHGPQDS